MKNLNTFEIVFFARAGQGAKTAAEILAQAAMREGKYVQAFPYFGPERSGAPTRTYVRISDEEIRTHEPVLNPGLTVILDDTLVSTGDVLDNLKKNAHIIVNTKRDEDSIRESMNGFSGRLKLIDATGIAMEAIGQPRPNSVMLGKLVQVSAVIKNDSLLQEFRKIFEKKIGKELTEKNIQAIEKGYDSL